MCGIDEKIRISTGSSSVHHCDKHLSRVLHNGELQLWEEEKRRKHLALKAIREVPFLHNQFPLLAEPSQNAFSENKGENPTFSNPES